MQMNLAFCNVYTAPLNGCRKGCSMARRVISRRKDRASARRDCVSGWSRWFDGAALRLTARARCLPRSRSAWDRFWFSLVCEQTQLLLVPMGAAFVALLAVSGRVDVESRVTLVAVLGGWAGVYVVGLLRNSEISRVAARRASIALALFACLAAVVLLDSSPTFFTLVIAGVTAVAAALAIKSDDEILLAASSLVAVGFVSIAAGVLGYRSADTGAVAFARRRSRRNCRDFGCIRGSRCASRLARGRCLRVISVATLGFTGAVVLATWSEVSMLRALCRGSFGNFGSRYRRVDRRQAARLGSSLRQRAHRPSARALRNLDRILAIGRHHHGALGSARGRRDLCLCQNA